MIIACVRVGTVYPMLYVERLRNMVKRNMHRPYRMVCLTDRPERCAGVEFIDISQFGLPGWWSKLALFRQQWRDGDDVLYLDLDTVICGSLVPLCDVDADLAICGNFAREHGNVKWPCAYGSCVMRLGRHLGEEVWNVFWEFRNEYMHKYARFGDQRAIEDIYPHAVLVQDVLPGYAISYRALKANRPPPPAAIINFGGRSKPDNTTVAWVGELWR